MATDIDVNTRIEPLKVFYSYARADADLRNKLSEHLAPLRDDGLIVDWYDDAIDPGAAYNEEIQKHIDESELIILLVDASFLASAYIKEHELPRALDREKQKRARVVPVLLRRFENWRKHALFADRQGLPSNGLAVDENRNLDATLASVAEGIRRAAEGFRTKRMFQTVTIPPTGRAVLVSEPPFDASLFHMLENNPYKNHYELQEENKYKDVRAYLWLPPRSTFGANLPRYSTMAVVCDAGRPRLENRIEANDDRLKEIQAYFTISPANLNQNQRGRFVNIAGQLLEGTFIVVAAIPKLLLGERGDDPDLIHEIMLNLMVLPLASGHAQINFSRLDLKMNPIDKVDAKSPKATAHAKKLLKLKFGAGNYGVENPSIADPDYTYLYAARFLQWAAGRRFNEGMRDWLDQFQNRCT